MRIFVDVGGHYGETLEVALDPKWRFDRVYSFEPARTCVKILRKYRDSRVVVVPVGLSNKTTTTVLYDPGSLGASVYPDKLGLRAASTERIQLLRASSWLSAHTAAGDDIYLKLNCEGSECDVIEDLLGTNVLARVRSIYVDFDVRKIPSQAYRQHAIEQALVRHGVDFAARPHWSVGGNAAVSCWLDSACPVVPRRTGGTVAALRYRAGLYRPAYMWVRLSAQRLLPMAAFTFLARLFGGYSRRNPARQRPPRRAATTRSDRE